MAAYLALRHKVTGEVFTRDDLIKVDEMLCAFLKVPCDAHQFHAKWMDWIGFTLATKNENNVQIALQKMRENARNDEQRIIDWFSNVFDNVSYFGR